jgi:hypothetical protein
MCLPKLEPAETAHGDPKQEKVHIRWRMPLVRAGESHLPYPRRAGRTTTTCGSSSYHGQRSFGRKGLPGGGGVRLGTCARPGCCSIDLTSSQAYNGNQMSSVLGGMAVFHVIASSAEPCADTEQGATGEGSLLGGLPYYGSRDQ